MSQPLSVALLTYSTKPRGGVVHTLELGEALHDLGVEVTVYALNKDSGGFYREPRCPYRLIPAAPPAATIDAVVDQRIAEMVEGLRAIGASHHVWHSQDCISANALATLRDEGKIPRFLRTVHHLDDYDSAHLRACQERSVRAADRCAVVSATWQAALRAQLGVHASIIPNGVDTRRFSPARDGREEALRVRLRLGAGPVYLTVGGVEPRKNSIALLRAFIALRRETPGAQLVIAGGETLFDYEPYQREFMAVAREAGLLGEAGGEGEGAPPPLVLAGVLPDAEMPALYRLGDVFVFPSIREGFGIALIEAMASGVPVVASAHPPFTEFLMHGDDALLVEPHDWDTIAEAMRILRDEETRARLRAAALATARSYTWKRSARAALAVYHEYLGEGAAAVPHRAPSLSTCPR